MYPKEVATYWGSTSIPALFDVSGKIVVVTGGGRGIGLMIAQGFVENGAKVILISRSQKQLDEAAKVFNEKKPGSCYGLAANISEDAECKRVAEEIKRREGRLDVLVNNAGANWGEAYETYPDSAFAKVLNLNVKAVFNLTRYLTPLLERKDSGHSVVINIGSIDGIVVNHQETYAYSASKAAVHHLTRVLANRLAPYKINVNAIAAGSFETKMTAEILKRHRDEIMSNIPLQRIGTPADISGLCIYLASKSGSWMTGSIIVLDGGVVIKARM
jgi:NAD(P)-dependent dehydrogenase (short-subunit alcohol dehydrogenase family)